MSQGFHRPYVVPDAVAGVAVVPVRQGADGPEMWVGTPGGPERRSPSWEDGEGGVQRAALQGRSEGDAVLAVAAGLGLRSRAAAATPLGRWCSPAFAPARWALSVWGVPVPNNEAPATGGVFRAARDLADAHRRGVETPGPLLTAVARALATSDDLRGAEGVVRCEPGGAEEIDLGGGVLVVPLRTPTLPPATHTSCVILGGGEALVVDPGSPYGDEQERLARVIERRMAAGDRFGRVVLTHHHHDHAAGAEALRACFDAVIVAHPETARLLGGRARVDELILDGDVLPFGADSAGRGARVVATPGHAPGHVVLVDDGAGVVVAGDMVAGQGTIVIDPPEGDMAVYLRSLETLRDLDARVVVPAHGPPIVAARAWIQALIDHRAWREERLLAELRQHGAQTIAGLVARVYDDVPLLAHPLAARQALAHLLKLAGEGRAGETTDGRWWTSAAASVAQP